MSDDAPYQSVFVCETVTQEVERVHGTEKVWTATVTWRQLFDGRDRPGRIYAAGLSLRGWSLGVSPDADSADRIAISRQRPPELSSDFFVKRTQWGAMLSRHREQLEQQLMSRVDRVEQARLGDSHPASRWAEQTASAAERAVRDRTHRAGPKTFRDVARAYADAALEEPGRVAIRTLQLLQLRGYALDENNASDKAKVGRWIGRARQMGLLAPLDRNEDKR